MISYVFCNNFCSHVYAEKSHSHTLILSLSHSFNLSFSLSEHAEQLLFSCLCWKVTLSHSHCLALSLFQSLIQSLWTCWTTFVFMFMLKNHILTISIAMLASNMFSHLLFVFWPEVALVTGIGFIFITHSSPSPLSVTWETISLLSTRRISSKSTMMP